MPLGLYISIPFCKSKCSYCNFASGVFPREKMRAYVERLCSDIERTEEIAAAAGGLLDRTIDSIYFGGGTPTLLAPTDVRQLISTIRRQFTVDHDAEITIECAPGTLTDEMIEAFRAVSVNRVSLGVQSFIDQEARAVGRLHSREMTLKDIERLRAAGISNINVDLIAGLPHQTEASWRESLDCTIDCRVPHVSVYMLEVDEDSRLGRELLAGGTRYHAHFAPDEELTAQLYTTACEALDSDGISQYEISNFARAGMGSRHNRKYWTRQPYLGFGVDAHSMLLSGNREFNCGRLAWPDSLEAFIAGASPKVTRISERQAWEETFFLGLRLNRGVNLSEVERRFGSELNESARAISAKLSEQGLAELAGDVLKLTARGRLLSNEVFEMFLTTDQVVPIAVN